MTKTPALVPVEEYLHSTYEPDAEYVDGEIQERNLGEKDHSKVQKRILAFFLRLEESAPLRVFPEQRVQVAPARYRVPDVCVTIGEPDEQIFTKPPLIVIEILSPEDRATRVFEKVRDYVAFGVPHIWVFDPQEHLAWVASEHGLLQPLDGIFRAAPELPDLALPVSEIFA